MKIVGNWKYAGTNKFVTHAVSGSHTLCGMNIDNLMARRGQEWEESESEICGCKKCLRHLQGASSDNLLRVIQTGFDGNRTDKRQSCHRR